MAMVKFPFTFQIGSPDTIILKISYSLDSGKTFTPTTNVSGVLSGLFATTNDTLVWKSLSDIPGLQSQQARMKILPIGKLDTGVVYLSSIFTVDNKPPALPEHKRQRAIRTELCWDGIMQRICRYRLRIKFSCRRLPRCIILLTPDSSGITDTTVNCTVAQQFSEILFCCPRSRCGWK